MGDEGGVAVREIVQNYEQAGHDHPQGAAHPRQLPDKRHVEWSRDLQCKGCENKFVLLTPNSIFNDLRSREDLTPYLFG